MEGNIVSLNPLPFEIFYGPEGSLVDITRFVTAIDGCHFAGSGKIRNATLTLNALEGQFITNTNLGTTPQINEFDQIKIRWQDENQILKSAIFEVDIELSQKNASGTILTLELKARERALQDMMAPLYLEFVTPLEAIFTIQSIYNINRGTQQAGLLSSFVDTGPLLGVTNIYDFTTPTTYYDALMHVIERLNQPTTNGGVGNFYSLYFTDSVIPTNAVRMHIKVQGSGHMTPTFESTDINPFHDLSARIDSTKATQVIVRGMPSTGSVPVDFHQFSSMIEEINHYPAYNPSAVYVAGQYILENGVIYRAIQTIPNTNPPPNPLYWNAVTVADVVGTIQYSPWTNEKAVVTKNSCSNPQNDFIAAGFDSPAFPDGNLVIRENTFFADFVDIRAINDETIQSDPILQHYLRDEVTGGIYKGFRILVDTSLGDPGGSFGNGSGVIFTDRFGRTFENSLVQYTGNEWIVIRTPTAPTLQDKAIDHCSVLQEGKVYEFNTDFGLTGKQKLAIRKSSIFRGGNSSGPFAWRDLSDSAGGNHPFHHPASIENVKGLISPLITSNQDISSYLTNSAIKITYTFSISQNFRELTERIGAHFETAIDTLEDLVDNLFEDSVNPTIDEINTYRTTNFYDIGWWYALPFPYPKNTLNGITEGIGDLYGLGNIDNVSNFGSLDIKNTTFSHSGKRGLNHNEVGDLGSPFTGLGFYFNFLIMAGNTQRPLLGDIAFTVTIYDDLSQVWRADFDYRHFGDTDEFVIPFGSFTVNRPSRTPWTIDTALSNYVHVPELEIRDIFQERRVRLITFQLKSSYDDQERYMPINFDNIVSMWFGGLGSNFTTIGIIDALRLVKTPMVSSGVIFDRVINPKIIDSSNTRNLRQLEAQAIAYKQTLGHKFETYNLLVDVQCNLEEEQSIFLLDHDLVKYADKNESAPNQSDGIANTRKLVVMDQNFTYNAEGNQSGALVNLTLTKRLEV